MAHFWHDVVMPVWNDICGMNLSPREKSDLVAGIAVPKVMRKGHAASVPWYLVHLWDMGLEGGQRLLDVLHRSRTPPNPVLARYLCDTWELQQEEQGPGPANHVKEQFWIRLLQDNKSEITDILERANLNWLEVLASLQKWECVPTENAKQDAMLVLDGPAGRQETVARYIDQIVANGHNGTCAGFFFVVCNACQGPDCQPQHADSLHRLISVVDVNSLDLCEELADYGVDEHVVKSLSSPQHCEGGPLIVQSESRSRNRPPARHNAQHDSTASAEEYDESPSWAFAESLDEPLSPVVPPTFDCKPLAAALIASPDLQSSPKFPRANRTPEAERRSYRKQKRARLRRKPSASSDGLSQNDAYRKAIRKGKLSVPHGRVMVCGKGRTGKTCIALSLLNKLFQKLMDSTLGVQLIKAVCSVQCENGQYVWKEEGDEMDFYIRLVKKAVTDYLAGAGQETKDEPKTSAATPRRFHVPVSPNPPGVIMEESMFATQPDTSELSSGDGNIRHTGPDCTPSKSPQRGVPTDNEIQQLLDKFILALMADDEMEGLVGELVKASAFLEIWDFAGQKLFAAIQHVLFSAVRCAYVVVFDASQSLDAPHVPTMGIDGREIQIPGTVGATNFDILASWLNVISQVIGATLKAPRGGGAPVKAPLFIVGTKIDQIPEEEREGRLSEIKQYIWSNAKGKYYENCIDGIIFVNNTLSGSIQQDPGIQTLRNRVMESLNEQLQLPIPLTWLPVSFVLRKHAQDKSVPWVHLEDAKDIVLKACGQDDSSEEVNVADVLSFYHSLGHIRHYVDNKQLKDIVFINIPWLTDIISVLFCPQPKEKQNTAYRNHYDLLEQRGILTESLAMFLWENHSEQTRAYTQNRGDRDILFHVMEQFALLYNTQRNITVPGTSVATRKFIVPSMVSCVAEKQQELHDVPKSPPLFLYCGEAQVFPETLFWRLVVRVLQKYSPSEDPVLLHTAARVLCYQHFYLELLEFQHGVSMVVEMPSSAYDYSGLADGEAPTTIQDMCHELTRYIDGELADLTADSVKHINLSKAFPCRCSLNNKACSHHQRTRCAELDCQHYVTLERGKRPHCPQGARPFQDEGFKELCDSWPVREIVFDSSGKPLVHPASETEQPPQLRPQASLPMSPMRQLSGSVAERATQYRKGCQKHAMALSSRLNGLRYASILQADCYLSESDVEEIEAKQTTLGPHRASSLFLKKFQKLNDSVVCSFIEKTLLKDGRTDVIRTLQCCQGPGVCEFGPEELHPGDSRTDSVTDFL